MKCTSFALVLVLAACSPQVESGNRDGGNPVDLSDVNAPLAVEPSALQTITVLRGQSSPTVGYTATMGGKPVAVAWSVDRGDLGGAAAGPASSTTVTPTGTTGGMLIVRARLGATTIERKIFIQLDGGSQNGLTPGNAAEQKQIPGNTDDLKLGGGVGGVGGEGLGPAVTDPATLTALGAPTMNGQAEGLTLLYPYDATVWPRGMLAPLLMWRWTPGDADAIRIELSTTSGSFKYSGTFARPAILATTMGPFIRHPIPQDVWDSATNTAGGPTPNGDVDKLTVKITLAKGGVGYGPLTQTWAIAPARLTGTVYYNSYGTQLVKNWAGQKDTAGNPLGAAILSVRSGDTAPKLIIGQNSPLDVNGIPTTNEGCRVCHIVASRGRWLITQAEGNSNQESYLYDLNAADVQGSAAKLSPDGTFAWSAMVGDGSYAITNAVNPSSTNPAIAGGDQNTAVSGFYQFGATPMMQTLSGLPAGVAAGHPTYSPDDKLVSYVDATGTNSDLKDRPLIVASYDATTHAFSNLQTIYTPPTDHRVGYPAFLPDNSGVIFEHEVRKAAFDNVLVTRSCARSELWWTKLGANMPVGLKNLNGIGTSGSYLPTGGKNHGVAEMGDPQCNADETGQDDTTLAYEPTVLPIVSGGYAWVVFTSRRLYGNQLTNFPWNSWPQNYDTRDLAQATVKKLWVAAIDLNAAAGADPSHPAFYLPAQELLAGNSRGFWVLDPCRANGQSCESGDQCCNGFCQPDPANPSSLVCSDTASCAGLQEKCATAADCCDTSNLCINGFCATTPIL